MQIRTAILTISDRSSKGEREDISGRVLSEAIQSNGWALINYAMVPDEIDAIKTQLIEWCDSGTIDLVLTTGGTGFAPRDVTPEATSAIVERPTPGLCEMMRSTSFRVTPHAMLSRAVAGIRKRTLVVNFPGSPRSVIENLQVILPVLPHAISLLRDESDSELGHQSRDQVQASS